MLIYQKTSGAVDWKSVFWFALGVVLGLGAARIVYSGAVHGDVRPGATARALEPRSVARPARLPESSTPSLPESRPLAKEAPRTIATPVETDVSLAKTSDAGRREMAPPEPAPDALTPVKPPDAASAIASVPSQADIDLENDLRSSSESASAQAPSATDTSLLPHERL